MWVKGHIGVAWVHTGVKGHGGQKVKGHVVTWRGKVMGFCPIA